MEAYNRGDAKGVASYYTEDGKVMPPGMETQIGREDVAGFYAKMMELGGKTVVFETQEIGPLNSTDSAFEWCNFHFKTEKGDIMVRGKYVVIWKKIDGQWRVYIDCVSKTE